MKKFLVQSFLLIVIILGALILTNPKGNLSNNIQLPFLPARTKIQDLQVNGQVIKVEVADTKETRRKGLGGKTSLGENEGMLFIFETQDKYPFWMKGLSFPLDFVWIKGDQVVDILQNIKSPTQGQADADLPIYSANSPVDKVLELNAGTVQKYDIKVGDLIKLTPL